MQGWIGVGGVSLLLAGAAAAQDMIEAGGHQIGVADDGMGTAILMVDGTPVHENGVIYLDPDLQVVGGVTLVTGSAGSGGNACGAAPFVLALPEGSAPQLYGPVDSCREFQLQVQPEALVFTTEPLPAVPGEVWVWTPVSGLTEGVAQEFAADQDLGWEALDSLAGAHPADAMQLAPVLAALQAGLGADYAVFAERISDLGSGDLVESGYLGRACLKFTCEADWAVLYLHRETEGVFAIWHADGEIESRIWPEDTTLWPPEAMAVLREAAGD
jgi:hypothetical protein